MDEFAPVKTSAGIINYRFDCKKVALIPKSNNQQREEIGKINY